MTFASGISLTESNPNPAILLSTMVRTLPPIETSVCDDMSLHSEVSGVSHSSLESLCPADPCLDRGDSVSCAEDLETTSKIAWKNSPELLDSCINSIRFLSVDAINNANSGHPGVCMGMAPAAFVLFDIHLRFNPGNPQWMNRDRFVLSAGHGSMLLYSLLHLYGYESVTLCDILKFRQLHSRTPGHPECTETQGAEVCTGPLGQGISNAVGIALAEAHMAAVYNRPGYTIVDNFTYCIAGDGCMMEGISAEACSLAGHLKLGKLIVLYDDNNISIEGSTDLAFTEDVSGRFEAYGWQVLHVAEGNTDINGIDDAIWKARLCTDRPSLIKVTTIIGFGSPGKSNSSGVHGSALGAQETEETRKFLNFEHEPFQIPRDALEHMRRKVQNGRLLEEEWEQMLLSYAKDYPTLHQLLKHEAMEGLIPEAVEAGLRKAAEEFRCISQATRKHSKVMLNAVADALPHLMGGAADTAPSTLTYLDGSKDFTELTRSGRNIRFGVREHAMGAISNGISLSGYNLRAFCSTFFVFSDYMRAAMRMASLSQTGTIFVMTHDSVGLGEDGPSHQPIEHLASFRAMPNHAVWRPADAVETAAAYFSAIRSTRTPSSIVLSRQTTASVTTTNFDDALLGGYIVYGKDTNVDGTIIATGSELDIGICAATELNNEGYSARVVSLPCWEAFERQEKRYQKETFGVARERRVVVEAASRFGWERYADHFVCVDEFGKSGKGKEILEYVGVNVATVKKTFLQMLLDD